MNLNFTKLMAVVCLTLVSIGLSAQGINRLQITAPESIAGSYDIVPGAFGMNEIEPLSGELLLIEDDTDPTSDGCTAAVNDLTGFIAFIDRGGCPFVDKAANAQAAGAIAMLVCNNDPAEDPFVMGGDAPDITIPIAMASFDDCATIRAEFGSSVSATLDFFQPPCVVDCGTVDFPAGTVWGQNGEGSFACGLGDWTSLGVTDETSIWKWDADTTPVGQSGAPRSLDSPSACNGAAQMDFCDYNFNPGPPSTATFFASDLLSPLIDLTGVARPVIHFSHYLCTLSEDQQIAFMTYSRDGGATWLDTVPILSSSFINTNETSETFETETVKMPFCGDEIGNTDQFRIRFIANGNFYFWTIDDVYITDETIADAEAFVGWFAGAPNFKTPASQVDKLAFMVDANNNGNTDFTDVSFTATVTKDGAELHSVSQELGALPKCTNVENVIAPDLWDMSSELGQYEVTYVLDATSDFDDTVPENNTVSSTFMVTESTFSKLRTEEEAEEQYMAGLGQNATYVSYANGYYITNGGGMLSPLKLTTGFGTDIYTDYGFTTLTGEVREWVLDTNGDGFANLETETTLLAQGQVLLDPDNPIDLRNIEIDLLTGSGFTGEFAPTGQYLAIIHVAPLTPPAEDTFMAPLCSGFVNNGAGNKDYYFAPADFAFEELGEGLGRPGSLSDFAGAAGTPTDQGARNLDPADGNVLSWHIAMEIGVVSSTVEIDETIDMSIFPNPATNQVTVDLNLTEVSKAVNIQIVDISGKIVANNNFTNVRDSALNINTTDLTSGVYMINVFTDSGVKSERILIQK